MKLAFALIVIIPWLSFNAFVAVRLGIARAVIAILRNRFRHRPPEITRETYQPR